MYELAPPDRSWRELARRRLLGADEPGALIITPLRTIHRALRRSGGAGRSTSGWLQAVSLGSARAVLSPPGPAVVDVIAAQEPGTVAVFVGLCGALADISIGSVLVVERARDLDGSWHRPGLAIDEVTLRSVSNAQVGCLLESYQRHDELEGIAETVDMECGSVLATAERCDVRAAAILVVSDRNRDPGVFDSRLPELWGPINAACEVANGVIQGAAHAERRKPWRVVAP